MDVLSDFIEALVSVGTEWFDTCSTARFMRHQPGTGDSSGQLSKSKKQNRFITFLAWEVTFEVFEAVINWRPRTPWRKACQVLTKILSGWKMIDLWMFGSNPENNNDMIYWMVVKRLELSPLIEKLLGVPPGFSGLGLHVLREQMGFLQLLRFPLTE